jgi:hypothetical protein
MFRHSVIEVPVTAPERKSLLPANEINLLANEVFGKDDNPGRFRKENLIPGRSGY